LRGVFRAKSGNHAVGQDAWSKAANRCAKHQNQAINS
jgi:hypothetical protein